MKLFLIPSSQGSLGKNIGSELAPQRLAHTHASTIVDVAQGDIIETQERIFRAAKAAARKKPVFVGGDHSLTYSAFRAISNAFRECALVIFDAHADCASNFKPVSHEDFNRVLIEDGELEGKNLIIVGVRKIYPIERGFLKKRKVNLLSASEIKNHFALAKETLATFLAKQKHVYLSFDIDCLDSKIAPATGYAEKNGVSQNDAHELLRLVLNSKKVRAMDIVEINPLKKGGRRTLRLGRKIISEFAQAK